MDTEPLMCEEEGGLDCVRSMAPDPREVPGMEPSTKVLQKPWVPPLQGTHCPAGGLGSTWQGPHGKRATCWDYVESNSGVQSMASAEPGEASSPVLRKAGRPGCQEGDLS